MTTETIHYRLPGRAVGVHVGAHRGYQYGAGMEFMTHHPLWRLPEPKRIDIRASLCNPWQELVVRVFRQKASIPVVVLADISASLGSTSRLQWMSEFVSALGYSVKKTGDRFAFIGCDETIRQDFIYTSGKQNNISEIISQRLKKFTPVGSNSLGLLQANAYMPKKSLVFLVSDFYFQPDLLDKILTKLAGHFVVPVVLAIPQSSSKPKQFAMANLLDAETGKTKFILMTPKFHDRIAQQEKKHHERIASVCRLHGNQPLVIKKSFAARDITNYFFPVI